MNRISLEWLKYPDGMISAVAAHGLTDSELRHYAAQVGIRDLSNDESRPVLLGTADQCDDLLYVLEIAGYEIDAEEFTVPPVFDAIGNMEASTADIEIEIEKGKSHG